VAFADRRRGVAAGDNGAVVFTTDGGLTWRSASLSANPDVRSVAMVSQGRVYASGSGGALLISNDGGRSWVERSLPAAGMAGGLDARSDGRVWVAGVGGVVARSRDYGRTWSGLDRDQTVSIHAIARTATGLLCVGSNGQALLGAGDASLWRTTATGTTAHLRAVAVLGSYAWAVGDESTVVVSADGGEGWRQVAGPAGDKRLYGACAALGRVWVVGERGLLASSGDGGTTWVAASPQSDDLHCITFEGEHGWAGGGGRLGDERAVMLRSQDGGGSWSQVELPVWGSVRALDFVDASRGWAVALDWGEDGDVRSGAILATSDGGRSWTVQARAPEALTSLSMSDDTNGWAFGENGMALQTEDGGVTWITRRVGTNTAVRGVLADSTATFIVGDAGAMKRGTVSSAAATPAVP
jgi:photosystem II stability/assembly factor-like uncharacterized protein